MRATVIIVVVVILIAVLYMRAWPKIRRERMIAIINEKLGSMSGLQEKSDEELEGIIKSIL